MTDFVTCSGHVQSADLGSAVVLLDRRTGRVETLLGWARLTWLSLARTADAAALTGRQHDLVRRLVADQVLLLAPAPRPWAVLTGASTQASWGTQEVPGSIPPRVATGPASTILATAALGGVLIARHLGRRSRSFARITALLATATRLPARAASAADVARALHCVRNVALIMPFRVACLEETAAAMLALAVCGRRAGWCHGIAADPIRLHAWLSVDGRPSASPRAPTGTRRCSASPEHPGTGERQTRRPP